MKHKRPDLAAASRVVVRTPILSFDVLARWGGAGEPRDVASLRAELVALIRDPVVREAIFVSTPALEPTIDAWLAAPDHPDHKDVEHTVIRYLSRMAGRATPFGLMSSIGTGGIGGPTRLAIPGLDACTRHVRLDNDYLASVCAAIAARPDLRAGLRYHPNSSLYMSAGRLRYAEVRLVAGRSYHLVVVEPSDYLVALLARARSGATIGELADVLCEDPDVGRDDAEAFVGELIDTQLLVPDLEPPVTGAEPLGPVIDRLRALPGCAAFATSLATAGDAIEALERLPLGAPSSAYRAIATDLGRGMPVPARIQRLFQVDLFRSAPELTIGPAIVDEVARGVDLLRRIGGAAFEDSFSRFRTSFAARYETREVPLVEVLDEETGIGFGNASPPTAPLLDVAFPSRPEQRRVPWNKRDQHLMRLVQHAIETGATEIVLTAADEAALVRDPMPRLGELIAVPFAVATTSPEALAAGEFTLRIVGTDNPGPRMLGRFCHGSPEIAALVREQLAIEESRRPDAVFAEVVHLPEGRLGNILLRPVLRGHEIAFLGRSGADAEHQLPVTDLMVSVLGDRVVLRSRKLGVEIIPRMTTAHNFTRWSLGMYRFLCSLASQDGGNAAWVWGAFIDAPFVPRIRSGRLVLARARWSLSPDDLAPIAAASKAATASSDGVFAAVTALRTRLRLPRWIVLSEDDHELPIDLANRLSVDSFADLIRSRDAAVLHELYPPPDQLAIHGPDGVYLHELQLLFSRGAAARADGPRLAPRRPATAAPIVRSFPPGSPWLYLKLYTGYAMVDELLRQLAPVLRELVSSGLAQRWFFIRYGDPDWHLRLRIAGAPGALLAQVMPRLEAALAPFHHSGLIWRTQLDTYEREVERYGGPACIELAERLFAHDSDAVASIIEAYSGDEGAMVMWRLALRGVDRLLDDLGLSFDDKRKVVTDMRDGVGAEVGMDTEFQKRLGEKFRHNKAVIEAALATADLAEELAPGIVALDRRSAAIRPIGSELAARRAAGAMNSSMTGLAGSFIHMHVNRILAASPRQQELVLYDMLRRHYAGIVGRARQRQEAP